MKNPICFLMLKHCNPSKRKLAISGVNSNFLQEFNIPKNAITVGMFSVLYRKKSVYEFATSLKNVMNENELIWGVFGGGINKNVKAEILQNFDDDLQKRLIFTGFRDDVANIIKGIDVFIFPSHTEGLPTALLEAMALSRQVIAFDIEPMNEILSDKRGKCVKFLDTNALSEAIRECINDRFSYTQSAKNANQYVKQNNDLPCLKENMKKLLEQL